MQLRNVWKKLMEKKTVYDTFQQLRVNVRVVFVSI